MEQYDPDKTIPHMNPTETQRFRPVEQFAPQVGETRIYEGSLKLRIVEVQPGKGFVGEDDNGARFFITSDQAKDFKLVE